MSGPDFIVDIDGVDSPGASDAADSAPASAQRRPWLAVHWRCCHVYSRIYRNRAGTQYEGRCPGCQRSVRAQVGPDGTSARFFEAR